MKNKLKIWLAIGAISIVAVGCAKSEATETASKPAPSPSSPLTLRITSYNVCYTKLLRESNAVSVQRC